jgi:hypothetical protein
MFASANAKNVPIFRRLAQPEGVPLPPRNSRPSPGLPTSLRTYPSKRGLPIRLKYRKGTECYLPFTFSLGANRTTIRRKMHRRFLEKRYTIRGRSKQSSRVVKRKLSSCSRGRGLTRRSAKHSCSARLMTSTAMGHPNLHKDVN